MPVYLLHFEQPIAPGRYTAQHYLGSTQRNLKKRLAEHATGHGSRLCAVAAERGIGFRVARVWPGGRKAERRLKDRHAGPRLCPICNGALAKCFPGNQEEAEFWQ